MSEQNIKVKGKKSLEISMRSYFNSKSFADVCFIIEKEQIYAHKLILSSRSTYFSNLILANCKDNSTLEIEIEDSAPKIFLSILEYMYTDEIKLSIKNVWEIYKAAKFYELFDLVSACQDFIIQKVSMTTVLDILKNGQIIENTNIINHCYEFIEKNMKDIDLKTIENFDEIEKKIKEYKEKKETKTNYFENTLSDQLQTIQPWNSTGLPPTAFPAPESISAFPHFFNQKKETLDTNQPKNTQIAALHRRLSIVDDPSAAGKNDSILTQNLPGVFLQILVSCTTKLLSCERASLFMFDKNSDELVSQVANGERKHSSDIALKDERSRNVICSPILDKENKIIGVIEILHSSTKEFTLENESHLRTISALFSIVFEEKEREQEEFLNERTSSNESVSSTTSTSAIKHRKRSLFDLNYFVEEDFNFSEILEGRNSSDYKLPNEEMDTSFQNLLRSYSLDRKNSGLSNYQFGEISQPTTTSTTLTTLSQKSPAITKRDLLEPQDSFLDKNDPFQIDQQQYQEQLNQPNLNPQMMQTNQMMNSQPQFTFVTEDFSQNQNPKKKKKIENLPFMHFRIPRYELQFIQFDGDGGKKKKK